MQVTRFSRRLALLLSALSLTACVSVDERPNSQVDERPLSDWVSRSSGGVVFWEHHRVQRGDIHEVDSQDERSLEGWMLKNGLQVVAIDQTPPGIIQDSVRQRFGGTQGSFYVVRAVGGNVEGYFSAFARDSSLKVLYNTFGSCGTEQHRVIVIKLDRQPLSLSAGCSGAL